MPENTQTFEIKLHDVRIHARHGVFPQEEAIGNEFLVNLTVRIPAVDFDPEADDLASTLSYADLYALLTREMARRARLLETVCVRTANALKATFPTIQSGEIEIVKVTPPISGIVGTTGVKYFF